MTEASRDSSAAWAVEFGGTAVRLIRLSAESGRWRIEHVRTEPAAGPEGWAAAVRRLPEVPPGDPGAPGPAACISDELTLYRQLTLPGADPEVLDRMVRAQAEVLLPGIELLAWGWMPLAEVEAHDDAAGSVSRSETTTLGSESSPHAPREGPGGQPVLIAAVGRDVLDRAVRAMAPMGEPACVLPSAVGLAGAAGRVGDLPAEPCLVIEVNERHTGLLVMTGDRLHGCTVLEDGAEGWVDPAAESGEADDEAAAEASRAAVLRWARRLAEHERGLTAAAGVQPRRVILTGATAGTGAAVCEAVEAVLRRPVRRLGLTAGRGAEGGDDPALLPAAGAAWAMLEPDAPAISFIQPERASRPAPRRMPWRTIAAAVWVLIALLVMYQLDLREAERLAALLEERRPTPAQLEELDRSLSLGRYLEQTGVPPLTALGAFTAAAPDSMILDGWHYERNGRLRVSGVVGNVGDLDRLLNALAASPQFEGVELGPSSFDDRRRHWRFEADMTVRPVARYLADRPRAGDRAAEPGPPAEAERGGGEATAALDGRGAR